MATYAFQLKEEEPDALPLATGPAPTQQKHVLLIEDSEEAMMLVRYAIEQYGEGKYGLEWAENLSAGLNTLSREDIDIVILDLGLPESSGPESYAWVREVAPDVPVVVLTGDSRQETKLDVAASGVAGFLVKDQVSGRGLLQVIRTVLSANKPQIRRPAEMLRELLLPQYQAE